MTKEWELRHEELVGVMEKNMPGATWAVADAAQKKLLEYIEKQSTLLLKVGENKAYIQIPIEEWDRVKKEMGA